VGEKGSRGGPAQKDRKRVVLNKKGEQKKKKKKDLCGLLKKGQRVIAPVTI